MIVRGKTQFKPITHREVHGKHATDLVADVQVIDRLATEVGEAKFDADGTRRHNRNCTRESVQHGKASASDAIQ